MISLLWDSNLGKISVVSSRSLPILFLRSRWFRRVCSASRRPCLCILRLGISVHESWWTLWKLWWRNDCGRDFRCVSWRRRCWKSCCVFESVFLRFFCVAMSICFGYVNILQIWSTPSRSCLESLVWWSAPRLLVILVGVFPLAETRSGYFNERTKITSSLLIVAAWLGRSFLRATVQSSSSSSSSSSGCCSSSRRSGSSIYLYTNIQIYPQICVLWNIFKTFARKHLLTLACVFRGWWDKGLLPCRAWRRFRALTFRGWNLSSSLVTEKVGPELLSELNRNPPGVAWVYCFFLACLWKSCDCRWK